MQTLAQPEASSRSLHRTLSGELASDKLYEPQRVARTAYPREVLSTPAANGSGLPAGRTSVRDKLTNRCRPTPDAYKMLFSL